MRKRIPLFVGGEKRMRIMNELKNLIFHAAIWTGLILGFIFGINGAANVVLFVLWFVSILSFVLLIPDFLKELAKNYKESKLRNVWKASAFAIVGFLVWNGAIVTAVAYTIGILISIMAHAKMKEMKNEQK